MQLPTTIPKNESGCAIFEGIFSVNKAFYIRKILFIEMYFAIF
jgi:hypothetical protein